MCLLEAFLKVWYGMVGKKKMVNYRNFILVPTVVHLKNEFKYLYYEEIIRIAIFGAHKKKLLHLDRARNVTQTCIEHWQLAHNDKRRILVS